MTMTMTSTLGCQHPRPQSSDDGTKCLFARTLECQLPALEAVRLRCRLPAPETDRTR